MIQPGDRVRLLLPLNPQCGLHCLTGSPVASGISTVSGVATTLSDQTSSDVPEGEVRTWSSATGKR